jgi:RNA exonuclease
MPKRNKKSAKKRRKRRIVVALAEEKEVVQVNKRQRVAEKPKPSVPIHLENEEESDSDELRGVDANNKFALLVESKQKEVQEDVDNGQYTPNVFDDCRLEVNVRSSDKPLKVSDVQSVCLWLLGAGVAPKCAFVKHRASVDKLVVVYLADLGAKLVRLDGCVGGAEILSTLHRWLGSRRQMNAPGSKDSVHSTLINFLSVPFKMTAMKKSSFARHRAAVKSNKHLRKTVKKQQRIKVGGHESSDDDDDDQIETDEKDEQSSSSSSSSSSLWSKAMNDATLPAASFYLMSAQELSQHGYPLRERALQSVSYEGFREAERWDEERWERAPSELRMLGIDCEMCMTRAGSELTRISVVNANGEMVYDTLVKPSNPIEDYLTRYSGITKELMVGVKTTLADVQAKLLDELLAAQTILVGHSLENDLIALKLFHGRVIDSAITFPRHSSGIVTAKHSLSHLSERFLNASMQSRKTAGHDSVEDAAVAMRLVQLKIRHGPSFGVPSLSSVSMFEVCDALELPSAIVDRSSFANRYSASSGVSIFPCSTDDDVVEHCVQQVRSASPYKFVHAQLLDLFAHYRSEQNADDDDDDDRVDAILAQFNVALERIYAAMSRNSALVVMTGSECMLDFLEKRKQCVTNNDRRELESMARRIRQSYCYIRAK